MNIQQVKNINLNFILATARTGSTLLSSMFNAHPNVVSTSEEPFAYSLYPKYKHIQQWTSKIIQEFCDDFYLFSDGKLGMQFGTKKELETILEANKEHLTVEIAIKLGYLCFFPTKEKNEITTVVDKQIFDKKVNSHFGVEKVTGFYPESKFIILYRDPRDQALARFRMLDKQNKHPNYYRIACAWNDAYGKLYSLKNKIDKGRILEIKYEDLVSNPENELRKVCAFVAIPYYPVMLTYDEQIKKELSQNKDKYNYSPIDMKLFLLHMQGLTEKPSTDKVGFWKQGMNPNEANLIWTICGSLAEKIGYKKDEHFTKQPIKLKNYVSRLVMLFEIAINLLYNISPFFIMYRYKKIMYGKTPKKRNYKGKE
ncbi:MAG: sulfotransferase family protein [Bacteroidia bacterium]